MTVEDKAENKKFDPSIEYKSAVKDVSSAMVELKSSFDTKINELKEAVDNKTKDVATSDELEGINTIMKKQDEALKSIQLGLKRQGSGLECETKNKKDEEISQRMGTYLRTGLFNGVLLHGKTGIECKSMTIGNDPSGGYMVHPELSNVIQTYAKEESNIRPLSSVQTISTASYKEPRQLSGASAVWVDETQTRPATDTPTLGTLEITVDELSASPTATKSLLEDASYNIEQFIGQEVSQAFTEMEEKAFIHGNGIKMPSGLIGGQIPIPEANTTPSSVAPGYIATGKSGGFPDTASGDAFLPLIALQGSLKSKYKARARWIMNTKTFTELRTFRNADGNFMYQDGTIAAQPGTLLGKPIVLSDEMPDIGVDSFSIIYGDIQSSYLIIDRTGISIIRDVYTASPLVKFITTKRVGGGVRRFESYKLLKFSVS